MKRYLIIFVMLVFGFMGCATTPQPEKDQKAILIAISRIAINHLEIEKEEAQKECDEQQLDPCPDAEEMVLWIDRVNAIKSYIKDVNDLEVGMEEVILVADLIMNEMKDHDIDPHTIGYIEDIKIIAELFLKED